MGGRQRYGPNEKRPSVTTILGKVLDKPALVHWAATEERAAALEAATKLYEELTATPMEPMTPMEYTSALEMRIGQQRAFRKRMSEAANIGTQVHKRIEYELHKELGLPVSEQPSLTSAAARRSFDRWQDWRKTVELKVLAVEKKIASDIHGYVGTLDLLAIVEDRREVLDWKTSKAIYREYWLQNAAYRLALQELGEPTQGGRILRLPKFEDDPEFEACIVPEPMQKWADYFLLLAQVYPFVKEDEDAYRAKRKEQKAA